MKIYCPTCRSRILAAAMNVSADLAVCGKCDEAFPLSPLIDEDLDRLERLDVHNPPRGAWYRPGFDGWEAGATMRQWLGVLFLIPFTLIWSGGSLGAIFGKQIVEGKFDPAISLFGVPFFIGSVFLFYMTLNAIFGKVVVRTEQGLCHLFVGFTPLGWRRTLAWNSLDKAEREYSNVQSNGKRHTHIVLYRHHEESPVKFGMFLSDERQQFLVDVIKRHLLEVNGIR